MSSNSRRGRTLGRDRRKIFRSHKEKYPYIHYFQMLQVQLPQYVLYVVILHWATQAAEIKFEDVSPRSTTGNECAVYRVVVYSIIVLAILRMGVTFLYFP